MGNQAWDAVLTFILCQRGLELKELKAIACKLAESQGPYSPTCGIHYTLQYDGVHVGTNTTAGSYSECFLHCPVTVLPESGDYSAGYCCDRGN